ncbi:hypothetical protein EMPS_04136 [Entomortierella parvispora]|uniref:START domain-containing protein n=1 Tax=Entomortierella parvispora TaxID=205924 RepID=A0A9P3H820_9FUNG|nr:hypothetical protein EMPS_04136 [Entomortierella parvispora]
MVDTTQSPLAMLVLVTPYTILYIVNELVLHGVLDKIHYLFFELIFVLAFRRVFGLPDLAERIFPARFLAPNHLQGPIHIQSVEGLPPIKTSLANPIADTTTGTNHSDIKSTTAVITHNTPSSHDTVSTTTTTTTTSCTTLAGASLTKSTSKKPSSRPSTTSLPQPAAVHPYTKDLEAMERKFMNYIENNEIWEKVYEDKTPTPAAQPGKPWIEVFQYKERPMCYKIVARMNNSAAVTFDAMCDLDRRSDWDPMCVEARVLEDVKALPGTTVQYVRTKAVWPTASRDTVVLGTIKELQDGRLFMVNASVEHPSMPERVKEKIVRMETAVAGHIITPEDPANGSMSCSLIQVLDADLKGWIPDKVIQMVSTKAVPDGLRAINALIPKITPYLDSKALTTAAKDRMELESTLQDPRRGNLSNESMLEGHENDLDMDPAEVELPQSESPVHSDTRPSRQEQENPPESGDGQSGAVEKARVLREKKSDGDISISMLSQRLRALEAEIGIGLRSRARPTSHSTTSRDEEKSRESGSTRVSSTSAGAMERPKSSGSIGSSFRIFWEGVKENVGLGLAGKANKIIVAVLVVAVLGSSLAKLHRR